MKIARALLFLAFLLFVNISLDEAQSSTYIVPIDYPDLQTAINNVGPGSVVYVDTTQVINSPITISGKSNIQIFFRHGAKIVATNTFLGQQIVLIRNSNNIVIDGLEVDYQGTNPVATLYYISVEGSHSISLLNLGFEMNTGVQPTTYLVFVMIWMGSYDIVVSNLEVSGQSISTPVVFGVVFLGVLLTDYYLAVSGAQFSDIDVSPLGSFTGINIIVGSNERGRLSITNIRANNIRGALFRGVYIDLVLTNREMDIYVDSVEAYNVPAQGETVAVRDRLTFSLTESSRIRIGNVNTHFTRLSGVDVRLSFFRRVNITVERVSVSNNARTVPIHGVWMEMGSPFIRPGSGETVREYVELRLRNIWVDNLYSADSLSTGVGARFIGWFGGILTGLRAYLENINVSGTDIGLFIDLRIINNYRVWVERYFYGDRSGLGLLLYSAILLSDLHPVSTPTSLSQLRASEDLYIANSIVWAINVLSLGGENWFTIYESVVDELNSVISPGAMVRSVWTLETFVYSSYGGIPIPNVQIDYSYPMPALYSQGYTDFNGRYADIMDYYMSNPPPTEVGFINVSARLGSFSDSAVLPNYISATEGLPTSLSHYTLPAWYGEVVFYLPILALRALGFSHDMGTTYLVIAGEVGWYAGYYSYTPDELWRGIGAKDAGNAPPGWSPYNNYLLAGLRVSSNGNVIRVDGRIFYEGYWQPVTIYIDPVKRIVWSPGPVDFRGWF